MFEAQSKLIEDRLTTLWAGQTPISWDNDEYTPARGTAFIRFQLSWADSSLVGGTADAGRYRETGIITIGVFTPRGPGPRANQALCDRVADIYRGWNSGQMFVQNPYIVRVGEEEEWFHQNVIIPFFYDNCFTQEN